MGSIKATIVRIGNSQGIRIPKALIGQCRLQGKLALEPRGDHLIVCAVSRPRARWEEAFQVMAAQEDDLLLEGDVISEDAWDRDKWEWS